MPVTITLNYLKNESFCIPTLTVSDGHVSCVLKYDYRAPIAHVQTSLRQKSCSEAHLSMHGVLLCRVAARGVRLSS